MVPVTHSPPADRGTAIEIPALTKARLGLDAERSWIVCNEANVFTWPGPDLHAAGHQTPPSIASGPMPPNLTTAARDKMRDFVKAGRLRQVPHTE